MTQRKNPLHGTVEPMAGQRLPSDWQRQAQQRAAAAEAAYRQRLENGWREGFDRPDPNVARSARLSSTGSRPPTAEEQALRVRLNSSGSHQPLSWNELTGQK